MLNSIGILFESLVVTCRHLLALITTQDAIHGPPALVVEAEHNRIDNYRGTSLPVEVCERIIDIVAEQSHFVHPGSAYRYADALNTLRACALTCRAWAFRSQMHLFRMLRIYCAPGKDGGVEDIIKLIEARPALLSRIEFVTARGDGESTDTTLHLLPLKLPGHINGVQKLRMGYGRFCPHHGVFPAMRQFTSVSQLTLSSITFLSQADLRQTLNSFVALEDLRLFFLHWRYPDEHHKFTDGFPPSHLRLKKLAISSTNSWTQDLRSVHFIRWLGISGVSTRLQLLNTELMIITDSEMLAATKTLVQASRDTAQEIHIGFGHDVHFSECKHICFIVLRYVENALKLIMRYFSRRITSSVPTSSATLDESSIP